MEALSEKKPWCYGYGEVTSTTASSSIGSKSLPSCSPADRCVEELVTAPCGHGLGVDSPAGRAAA